MTLFTDASSPLRYPGSETVVLQHPERHSSTREHGSTFPRLLSDIGGTNARFGWQEDSASRVSSVMTLRCSEYADVETAVCQYLSLCGLQQPRSAALAIATPVTCDEVSMTNHSWSFSIARLREALALSQLCVINDFTALALAIPSLTSQDVVQFGGASPVQQSPIGLLGPGTGLGVSGLLPTGERGQLLPLSGEGGHSTLAAETPAETRLLNTLRARYGHVSAERILCGQGLVDVYNALTTCSGLSIHVRSASEVVDRWMSGNDRVARNCVDMFCGFLGSVAGNLALLLGAKGGIYIGGGIVPRLGEAFASTPFRERFESKGRFREYLRDIPTTVIVAPTSPALAGAARALDLGTPVVGRWARST